MALKHTARLLVAAAVALLIMGCARSQGRTELLVFAAASLTNAMQEIGQGFQAEHSVQVSFSFGASQTLAQQIASGAPADVLIAAGESPVELLESRGLVERRTNIAQNRLVVAARLEAPNISSLSELRGDAIGRIAVANPNLAPAGRYSREALTALSLWDDLQPKMVMAADVRAALAYLQTGSADIAFVYETDARAVGGVRVLDIVPEESYSPVVYPAVVIKGTGQGEAAATFLSYLTGDEARAIFRKHGFR